jgi:hypothetical protein
MLVNPPHTLSVQDLSPEDKRKMYNNNLDQQHIFTAVESSFRNIFKKQFIFVRYPCLILQHVDLLLGNGPYTQQSKKSCTQWRHATIEEVLQVAFSVGPLQGYMTQLTEFSLVSALQLSRVEWSELVEKSVRGLLQFSCCEPLLLRRW